MLTEIKQKLPDTLALFCKFFASELSYLFFMLILPPILILSLIAVSIPLSLFSPSFPVFDAHTLSHFIDSPLFSVLTLTPSGALARACSLSGEF